MESKLPTIHEDITTTTNSTNSTNTTKPDNYPQVTAYMLHDDISYNVEDGNHNNEWSSKKRLVVIEYKHTNKETQGINIKGRADKTIRVSGSSKDIIRLKKSIGDNTTPTIDYPVHLYEQGILNSIADLGSNKLGAKQPTTPRSLYQINTHALSPESDNILLLTSSFQQDTENYSHVPELHKQLHKIEIASFFEMNPNLEDMILYITEELAELYGVQLLKDKFKQVLVIPSKDNIIDTLIFHYWGFKKGDAVIPSVWTFHPNNGIVHPPMSSIRSEPIPAEGLCVGWDFVRTYKSDFNYVGGHFRPTQRTGCLQYQQDGLTVEGITVFLIKLDDKYTTSLDMLVSHTDNKSDAQMSIKINYCSFLRKFKLDYIPLYDGIIFSQEWEEYHNHYKTLKVDNDDQEETEHAKLNEQFDPITKELLSRKSRFDIYQIYKKTLGPDISDILTDKSLTSDDFKEYIKVVNHLINYGVNMSNNLLETAFTVTRVNKNFKLQRKTDKPTNGITQMEHIRRSCAQVPPSGRSMTRCTSQNGSNNDDTD